MKILHSRRITPVSNDEKNFYESQLELIERIKQ